MTILAIINLSFYHDVILSISSSESQPAGAAELRSVTTSKEGSISS
jgi:hypothetical protein